MEMNSGALRPGQREAIKILEQRVAQGEKRTALIIPTRYGKSDIARVATVSLVEGGLATSALALSPNELLRDQLGSIAKWNEALERYRLRPRVQPKITTLVQPKVRLSANGEIFLSSTIQLVQTNLQLFADWVEAEVHRTGVTVLVFDDECHMTSEFNTWGDVCETLVDAGAHLVLMTATGERADGRRIPGFEFDTLDEQQAVIWRSQPGSEPDKIRVQMLEGIRSRVRLKPHYQVTFRQAWDEGCLCKVNHIPFDVYFSTGKETVSLLELSQDRTTQVLGQIVRQAEPIMEGCLRLVQALRGRRERFPDTTALVFCGSDLDRDANRHARDIQRQLLALWPGLRITIATSKVESAKGDIDNWVNGGADVLIVKQMASLGLDAPRCKVLLDLSPTRKYPAMVQKIMRAATPWSGVRVMDWISPSDILAEAVWTKLIKEEGGEAVDRDFEVKREYEKNREEHPDIKPYVEATGPAMFDDNEQNRAEAEEWERTTEIVARFPELNTWYSHAEIAHRMAGFGDDRPAVIDTHAIANSYRSEINWLAEDIISKRFDHLGVNYTQAGYKEVAQTVWRELYRTAKWPLGVRLGDTDDLELLKALQAVVRHRHHHGTGT